jgi:hypothetical protein
MLKKLSIGIVTPTVSRAGGGIFPIVLAHAIELTRTGHEVTVYGLDDDPEKLDRDQWDGVKLKLYNPGPFGFSRALSLGLRRSTHDLLHQHALWSYLSIAVSRWRVKTGKPVVISSQGMLEPWALSNSAWKKRVAGVLFERRNVRGASAIHCSDAEVVSNSAACGRSGPERPPHIALLWPDSSEKGYRGTAARMVLAQEGAARNYLGLAPSRGRLG